MLTEKENITKEIENSFNEYNTEFKKCFFEKTKIENILSCINTVKKWYPKNYSNQDLNINIEKTLIDIKQIHKYSISENLNKLIKIFYKLDNIIKNTDYDLKNTARHIRLSFDFIKDYFLYDECYKKLDKYTYVNIELLINKCIILDHISVRTTEHKKLINELNDRLLTQKISNYKIFSYSAILNFRLHQYEFSEKYFLNVLKILEKILKNDPYNQTILKEYIFHSIRLGCCYELMNNFEASLKIFKELENNEFKKLNNISDIKIRENYKKEILHLLGHIYNENSIKNKFNGYHIYLGRKYLKDATQYDKDIKICEGTVLSEYNEHTQALEIYFGILNENNNLNIHDLNELYFYIAYSYYCLTEKNKAEKYYSLFDKYCEDYNYTDGLLYTQIFRIKLNLYNKNLIEIETTSIKSWLQKLKKYIPSKYSNTWIKIERKKLISLLNGYWYIKNILNKKFPLVDVTDDILFHLRKYVEYEYEHKNINNDNTTKYTKKNSNTDFRQYNFLKMKILILGNTPNINNLDLTVNENINAKFEKFIQKDIDEIYNNIPSLRNTNNLLVYCLNDIFEKYSIEKLKHLLNSNHKNNVNYILYLDNVDKNNLFKLENLKNANANRILNKHSLNSSIYFDDIENALKLMYILNVYEKIRINLSESKFLHLSTIPLNKDYRTFAFEPLFKFIEENNNPKDKFATKTDRKFITQLKNIEDWQLYRSTQEIKAETENPLYEYFVEMTNTILNNFKHNNLKFSFFYSANFKTNEYRVPYYYNNDICSKFDNRKPYSNTKVEDFVFRIINTLDKKIDCTVKPCNKNHTKVCNYYFEKKTIKAYKDKDLNLNPKNNILNNILKLIAEIPDEDIVITGHYSIWIKRILIEEKYSLNLSGLLISIFNDIEEKEINKICSLNDNVINTFYKDYAETKSTYFEIKTSKNNILIKNNSEYKTLKNDLEINLTKANEFYNKYKNASSYICIINDLEIIRKTYNKYLFNKNTKYNESEIRNANEEILKILNKIKYD